MKKLILNLFTITLLLTGLSVQAQKIAHVDVDSLLTMMPEYKTAAERSQAKLKELENFLGSLKTKYDEQMTYVQANFDKMSDLEKKNAQEELGGMEQRIQQRQAEAQQEYQTFNATMQKPIFDKVNKAIEMVAKEAGYKYVFSKTEGLLLYADPADDIMNLVKKKMDSMPLAILPGGGTAPVNNKPNNGGGGTIKPKPAGGK